MERSGSSSSIGTCTVSTRNWTLPSPTRLQRFRPSEIASGMAGLTAPDSGLRSWPHHRQDHVLARARPLAGTLARRRACAADRRIVKTCVPPVLLDVVAKLV